MTLKEQIQEYAGIIDEGVIQYEKDSKTGEIKKVGYKMDNDERKVHNKRAEEKKQYSMKEYNLYIQKLKNFLNQKYPNMPQWAREHLDNSKKGSFSVRLNKGDSPFFDYKPKIEIGFSGENGGGCCGWIDFDGSISLDKKGKSVAQLYGHDEFDFIKSASKWIKLHPLKKEITDIAIKDKKATKDNYDK